MQKQEVSYTKNHLNKLVKAILTKQCHIQNVFRTRQVKSPGSKPPQNHAATNHDYISALELQVFDGKIII